MYLIFGTLIMFHTPSFLKHPDIGVFLFRLVAGGLMLTHGVQGFQAGEATWSFLGQSMTNVGIHFALPLWGLMAVIVQAFGGLCFLLGLFFRFACLALMVTMGMALLYHIKKGDSLIMEGGQALLFCATFFTFMFIGPGRISVCKERLGCGCGGSSCNCCSKDCKDKGCEDKDSKGGDNTGCCC